MSMTRYILLVFVWVLLAASPAIAGGFGTNPERSFFIGFDLGAGLHPGEDARSPKDYWNLNTDATRRVEAVSLSGFLFGIYGGYRFNEVIALETGWHEQQHDAHPEWGGAAYFRLFHLAARIAWPTAGRQTPLVRIGPAIGGFTYGSLSSDFDDVNSTPVLGGLLGLSLEHEFTLGVVGVFEVAYIPSYRFGMDKILVLEEYIPQNDGGYTTEILDEKDFSDGQFVNILWISAGFQFEWTFR